jgi:hypothetical protein
MKSFIGVLGFFVLSACVDAGEREAMQAQQVAKDHAECLELGFKPETPGYGECRLRLRELRIQERMVNRPYFHPTFGMRYGYGGRW